MNKYIFKVKFYDNDTMQWYPPIDAKGYKQALYTLASDRNVDNAELKCIILGNGNSINAPIDNPAQYDEK